MLFHIFHNSQNYSYMLQIWSEPHKSWCLCTCPALHFTPMISRWDFSIKQQVSRSSHSTFDCTNSIGGLNRLKRLNTDNNSSLFAQSEQSLTELNMPKTVINLSKQSAEFCWLSAELCEWPKLHSRLVWCRILEVFQLLLCTVQQKTVRLIRVYKS